MLPKKNRVDKNTIAQIFNKGRFVSSANLTLKYIHIGQSDKQISFITPKTVSNKAVVRNQLRRRGYAVISRYIDSLPSGFVGAIVFGKKSKGFFGGIKKVNYNPILNLDTEIRLILNKIR